MKRYFLFFLILTTGCSTPSLIPSYEAGRSFKGRIPASDNAKSLVATISFPSGSFTPKGYLLSGEQMQTLKQSMLQSVMENGRSPNCFSDEAEAFSNYCEIVKIERELQKNPPPSPWKNLSSEEFHFLRYFTSHGYQDINQALWSQDPSLLARYEQSVRMIVSGINRLPPESRQVFRCDLVKDKNPFDAEILKVAERYQEGRAFTVRGFWSTSVGTDQEYIREWVRPCYVQLRIQLKGAGADVSYVSVRPEEQEILVLPMTSFKVIKKNQSTKNGSLFFDIEIEQIE
jgi:hypothetical protein